MKLTKLNELQMPTWQWLHMNAAELELKAELGGAYGGGTLSGIEQVEMERSITPLKILALPADLDRLRGFILRHQNYGLTVTIPKGVRCENPVVLDFILDESSPVLLDVLHIRGEEDSRADVVVRYSSSGCGEYFHGGFVFLQAEPGSDVRLIKIQKMGEEDVHLDGTAVCVGEGAKGSALFCELGGEQVVSGCNLSLEGAGSRGELDTLYLGSGERKQDFNYRLELRGPTAEGSISVKGALAGQARKVLKSTLDFITGTSGSKGVEEETVLTLSDRVVNLSTPLLLCGEADVEGAHATSSGRPDPGKLYYLMSRGLSGQEAKRLLVEASFTPILNKLPTRELQDAVYEKIWEVVHHES